MSALSLEEFGDRLVVLLPTLMQQMWAYERDFFSREDISFPQLWALTYLYQHKSCTMCELARAMHSGESTSTGLVDRMAGTKLVKRVRSRVDRRVVTVQLTANGSRAYKQLQRQRRRAFIELFRRVSTAERSRWLEIIEKLVGEMSLEKNKDRETE